MSTPREPVTEYALAYAGGEMLVHNSDPELEEVYPLDRWIKSQARFGRVYRRTVIVVEDWVEVTSEE